MTKAPGDDRLQIRFRLPQPLIDALHGYAEAEGMTLNYVVTKALREHCRRVAADPELSTAVRAAAAAGGGTLGAQGVRPVT